MPKAELDPWRVICSCLFEFSGYEVPEIIDRTGLKVDWTLTEKQDYSHNTRKAAYRPRINSAYDALSREEQLRVAHTAASQLASRGLAEKLNEGLAQIGWTVDAGRLVPTAREVRELFFPKDSQHDAYVEIRAIFQRVTNSIIIIDPYIDGSLFSLLAGVAASQVQVQILTFKMPADFRLEARKFVAQHPRFSLDVRATGEFHDRFVILNQTECYHIGASIKDAGNKAFMISQIEDGDNRAALIRQHQKSWGQAAVVPL